MTRLLASVLLVLVSVAASAAERVGQVIAQRGPVVALRDGVPRALHIGAPLSVSDRIRTGAGGKIEVAFGDGSRLVIGPDSEVTLAEFELRETTLVRAVIELVVGILRARIDAAPVDLYEVRGRTAIASVRGTHWIVQTSPENTAVFVVDGSVGVTAAYGTVEVTLAPGQGTDVAADGSASPPARWGQARVERVMRLTTIP